MMLWRLEHDWRAVFFCLYLELCYVFRFLSLSFVVYVCGSRVCVCCIYVREGGICIRVYVYMRINTRALAVFVSVFLFRIAAGVVRNLNRCRWAGVRRVQRHRRSRTVASRIGVAHTVKIRALNGFVLS